MGSETRQRTKQIMVRVNDEELVEAKRLMKAFSYPSPAALFRDLVLGLEPKSTLDQQALLDLLRVNADLGRLGGLLKHWLQAKGADTDMVTDIRALLRDIENTRRELIHKVKIL